MLFAVGFGPPLWTQNHSLFYMGAIHLTLSSKCINFSSAFSKPLLPPAYVVRREGNSFTLLVCPHLGGGVPISHNALQHFPECHGADTWGGTLPGPAGMGRGGTLPGPARGGGGGGYPARSSWGGTQVWYPLRPGQDGGGVTLLGGGGTQVWSPRPGQDRGGGGYPVRTTEGVLTTRRAVCLLRSRRRTFLFYLS